MFVEIKKLLISSIFGRYIDAVFRNSIARCSLVTTVLSPRVKFNKDSHLVFVLLGGIGDNVHVLALARDFYRSGYKNISVIVDRRQVELVSKIKDFDISTILFDKRTLKFEGPNLWKIRSPVAIRTNPSLENTAALRICGIWKEIGFIGSYSWFSSNGSIRKINLDLFDPRPIFTRYDYIRNAFNITRLDAPLFSQIHNSLDSRGSLPTLVIALDKSSQWDMPSTIDRSNLARQLTALAIKSNWLVDVLGERKNYFLKTEEGVRDLRGLTSLEDLIDLVSSAALVVAADNGVMHISSLQKSETVAIFTFTNSNHFAPTVDNVRVFNDYVECAPCTNQSMGPVNVYPPICSHSYRCELKNFGDLMTYVAQKIAEKPQFPGL